MLTLNFSIKDGLKVVSKTKMKNCLSMIDQELHYTYNKFRIHKNCIQENNLYLYIFLKKMHVETLNKNGLDFFHFD